MFVIKNISDSDVVLDDLRLVLGPNREIDLDKVASRALTDYSTKLRMAIHQRRVMVVVKDPDRLVPGTTVVTGGSNIEQSHLTDMEKRLKEEMSRQLTKKDQQIDQLTNAIQALVEKLASQPAPVVHVINQGGAGNESISGTTGSSPSDISDDIASSIHAKAMKRMEKNVSGNIEHEDTKVKDDSLNNSISELENLGL